MGLQRPMVVPDGRASTAHGASGKAGQGRMGQARGGSSNQAAWLSHLAWILVCQGPLGDAPSPEGVSLARVRESMATWRALVSAAPVRPVRAPYKAAKVQPYMTYA
jgi:hypothetical protein